MTTHEKDIFFSLYEIRNYATSNSYDLILSIYESENDDVAHFVSFEFNSLDLFILCLRILARNSHCYSLDILKYMRFPARITFEEKFNQPDTFKGLFLSDNSVWPPKKFNIPSHFLLDVLE